MSFFANVNLGTRREEVELGNFGPILTGIAKLQPVVVNPNLAVLNQMGYDFKEEPVYTAMTKRTINGVEQEVPVSLLNIYCKVITDNAELNEKLAANPYVRITFRLGERAVVSKNNTVVFINNYGQSSYFTQDQANTLKSGSLISGREMFKPNGIRKAMEGEAELIKFIRAFRNLPFINEKTTPENLVESFFTIDQMRAICRLDPEALKFFNGLFAEKHPETGEGFCVSMMLGARTNDKGYHVQDVYIDETFASYTANKPNTKATAFAVKTINDSQVAGRYKNTDFQLNDVALKEYNASAETSSTSKDDLFSDDEFAGLGNASNNVGNGGGLAGIANAAPAPTQTQAPVQTQATEVDDFLL